MINFDNAATTYPKPLAVSRALTEAAKSTAATQAEAVTNSPP